MSRSALTLAMVCLATAAITAAPARAGDDRPWPEPRFEIPLDKALPTPLHITDTLSVGVQTEVTTTNEVNFDLDREENEDVLETDPALKLKAAWLPGPNLLAYGETELTRKFIHQDPDGNDADLRLTISEAFVAYRQPQGLTVSAGRREVSPGREWLFDTDFDGVDLVYRTDDYMVMAAWWREQVIRKDTLGRHRDDLPDYFYLRGDVAIGDKSQAGLYLIGQNGRRRDRDDDLVFVGLSSTGDAGSGIDYWADAAIVFGQENGRQVRGWGFDAGGVWDGRGLPLRPHLAAGLAYGSGDDGAGTDTAFRQTGVQGNSQRFGGVVSVKRHGELFDPELSNLATVTLGAGVRPTRRSSIDLLYHEFFQPNPTRRIRDSALDDRPNGRNSHLGREVDLVLGIREFDHVNLDVVGGFFMPGAAFGDDATSAWFLETTIELKF